MTAALFLGFLAVMALAVRCLPRRDASGVVAGLAAWLLYAGLLGWFGVTGNAALRPPGIAYILGPVVLFILLAVARSPGGARVALAVPLPLLLGMQGFRVGVELFLHQLQIAGLAPGMLTFAGANPDILIGLSAPVAAWLTTRGRQGLRLALAWTMLSLLSLANIAVRSALTAPGPLNLIHAEVPNLVVATFPFMFIPAFFAPLAVVLHVLALRSLRRRLAISGPVLARVAA